GRWPRTRRARVRRTRGGGVWPSRLAPFAAARSRLVAHRLLPRGGRRVHVSLLTAHLRVSPCGRVPVTNPERDRFLGEKRGKGWKGRRRAANWVARRRWAAKEGPARARTPAPIEIGRASCRERGEISGGGGAGKRKKHEGERRIVRGE